jgi:hypothetical protein
MNITERRPFLRPELLLLVGSLVFSLLLAEVGLRVFYAATYTGTLRDLSEELPPPGSGVELGDMIRISEHPRLVYQLKPGLDNVYKGARVRTNAAGWREEELPHEKDAGVIRIVTLGDSVMFGHGVEVDERYTDVLEDFLSRRFPQARWEIVNLAVSGYNLVMEVEALKRFGLAYDPDLVLYGYIGNDFCLPNFVTDPLDLLGPESFLVHYLSGGGSGTTLTRRQEALVEPLDPSYNREEQEYEEFFQTFCAPENLARKYRHLAGQESFAAALSELAAIGRERQIPVVFMKYTQSKASPVIPEIDGIVYLNLTRPWRKLLSRKGSGSLRESNLVLSATDPHPSPAGHRAIADLLLQRMINRGLIEELLAR